MKAPVGDSPPEMALDRQLRCVGKARGRHHKDVVGTLGDTKQGTLLVYRSFIRTSQIYERYIRTMYGLYKVVGFGTLPRVTPRFTKTIRLGYKQVASTLSLTVQVPIE